jgi:DNA-binding XRE family transcriptional regulator
MLIRDAAALPPLLDGLVLLPDVSSQGSGIVIPPIEYGFQGKGLHVPDSAGDNYSRQARRNIPVTGSKSVGTMRPMGRGVAPTRFKSEFAERLKSARIAAGYETQQEFATALGVPIERYKKWESGRTPMPHQYIPAACELTGQDANYFFKVAAAKVFKKPAAAA